MQPFTKNFGRQTGVLIMVWGYPTRGTLGGRESERSAYERIPSL